MEVYQQARKLIESEKYEAAARFRANCVLSYRGDRIRLYKVFFTCDQIEAIKETLERMT